MSFWKTYLHEGELPVIIPVIDKSDLVIYDFDETIAQTDTEIYAINKLTGEKLIINSQEEYDELVTSPQGSQYDFDFSGFNTVKNPTELTKTTESLASDLQRSGTQVMILTARDPAAEDEIHMYLDSIGIDPSNLIIIGCGGCDKGEFVKRMVDQSPKIMGITFYDDSKKNISDLVRSRREILDMHDMDFTIVDVSDPNNWVTV
jgi:hypothetical protein